MERSVSQNISINSQNQIKSDKFIRKVDKNKIPTCNIMGVNIAAINMEWLLSFFKEKIKHKDGNKLSGDYICVSNVHTTVLSYENPNYCSIQNEALMAIPDGGPLASLGRKRGFKSMHRIAGPSLMEEIFKISVENGYSHYFYGSTEETLEKLRSNLETTYPGILITGSYSPPFRSLTEAENQKIAKNINATESHFIWVGLGAPKQEKWMAENQGNIKGLMVGVGAGFDYFAGNINRAPSWMQSMNMEWLYRLIQEPRRLLRRYMYTNTKFLWLTFVRKK